MKPRGIFTIQKFQNPNKTVSFRVTGTTLSGARVRENFQVEAEALARKQNLEVEAANFIPERRITTTWMDPKEQADAEAAVAFLKQHGFASPSAFMAAEFLVKNYRDPLKRIALTEAVDRFVKEKESANRRLRYAAR